MELKDKTSIYFHKTQEVAKKYRKNEIITLPNKLLIDNFG